MILRLMFCMRVSEGKDVMVREVLGDSYLFLGLRLWWKNIGGLF